MLDFAPVKRAFDEIEGMTSEPSALLFHLFLAQQRDRIRGPLLEIGCYKGKSAIVMAHHLGEGEHLDLVDELPLLDTEKFQRFGESVKFHLGNSDGLARVLPDYRAKRGHYRFIHSDASHTFANVVNDLVHADFLLHAHGIVVVDDYENPNYPQVPIAVGCALFKRNCKFSPFLVANNKLYLCRPPDARRLQHLVVNRFAPTFLEQHKFLLACTDLDPWAPISLRPADPGEGAVYGPEIYGDMIALLRDR